MGCSRSSTADRGDGGAHRQSQEDLRGRAELQGCRSLHRSTDSTGHVDSSQRPGRFKHPGGRPQLAPPWNSDNDIMMSSVDRESADAV